MIGLEFNENYIKLVELKETPQGPILTGYNIGAVELKPNTGPDLDAAIAETIEKMLAGAGINEGDVYTLVSGPMVQIRRLSLPPMPEVDLLPAVKFEAQNFTTFPVSDAVIDYFTIEKANNKESRKVDLLVLTVEKTAFKRLLAIINRAGLRCAGVTISAFALKEVMQVQPTFAPGELTAVLDVGTEALALNLYRDNIIQFIREIAISDQLPNEVLSSFTYYREQFLEDKVSRIFLSGEIAKVRSLQDALSTASGIPVTILDPLRGLQLGPKVDAAKAAEEAPRLALAIGLAKNRAQDMNLVKVKEKAPKKKMELDKKLESFSIPNALIIGALLFVLLLIVAANIYLSRSMDQVKKELDVKSLRLEQLTSFQERKLAYEEVREKRTEVKTYLGQIANLLPVGTSLVELSYDNQKRHFELAGETSAPEAVSGFIMRLDRSSEFAKVKLKEIKKLGKLAVFSLGFDLKKEGAK
jgi:Tfp pilus assembly PilM family ATPase